MSGAQMHLADCLACGYDLEGRALGESCPECGATIVENPFRGRWREAKVRRRYLRGSRCMVAAKALFGVTASMPLLTELLPWRALGDIPMVVADVTMAAGMLLLAASAVLFAFVWRAIVAVRVLVSLIAVLFAAIVVLSAMSIRGAVPSALTPELAGLVLSIVGAAIAVSPIFLARSSGRAMRLGWLPLISSAALVVLAIMALTFSTWGQPYEEIAMALVMGSQFGAAASFVLVQRSIAVALRDARKPSHA